MVDKCRSDCGNIQSVLDVNREILMKTSDIKNLGNAYRSIYEAKTKEEEVSDNKEFVPHMMYDPETGKGHKAEKPEDHERMKKMGYTHDEPDMVKEKKLPRQMLDPKKDVMVVKNNKVIVVDKSKEAEYLRKGWGLAEQIEEEKVLDNMSQLPNADIERPLKSMQQVKKDADLGRMEITHIVKNKQGNKVVAAVVSNGKKNFVYVNNKGVAPLKEETLDEDASNFKSAVARIKKAKSAKDLKKLEVSFDRVYKVGALTDKELGQLDTMIGDKLKKLGFYEEVEEAVSPEQQAAIAISKKEKEEMKNEGNVKDLAMKIDKIVAKMNKDSKLKAHAKKFASMAMDTMDIEKSLEKALPSSISGAKMIGLLEGKTKSEDASQFVAAARQAKKDGKDTFIFADKEYPVTCKEVEEAEKKLDPVDDAANDKKFKDRKDKDIDNDGDVDSSDEYLHNRRAKVDDAIDGGKKPAKNVKKEEMNPTDHVKKKGDKYCVYNADGSIAKEFDNKEDADKYAIDNHDKIMATAKKEEDEKKDVAKSPKTAEISKIGEEFVAFLEAAIKPDEKLKSDPKDKDGEELSKKATDDEKIDEKEPKKGKEFIKKHDGSDKEIEDEVQDSHDKTFKAGSDATKPKSGKRSIDNPVGDAKVVSPVKEDYENPLAGKGYPEQENNEPEEVRSLVDMARAHLAGETKDFQKKEEKERNPYDARFKEAKAFMARMDKRRGINAEKPAPTPEQPEEE